ncbi:alpha/beta hydrolase [Actinomadura roseirufa]|uniref:alpha/beta hydrolase n=1 Tax=Actinomadura roseirufa TaxID=2094049 RepID=UPI0010411FC1|nr:alpha/beta hydrolase [Actinomadura roseirufa]
MRFGRTIAGLLLCGPLVAGVPAPAQAAAPPPGKTGWKPCPDDAKVQCGKVSVPIDWSRPKGKRVDLALARRPALDPAKRIGSLLINPGGPGGSGVDFALYANEVFSPEIQRRFDIVGFDPRGVGRSHSVVCPPPDAPSSYPANAGAYKKLLSYNAARAKACRRLTGPLFDQVDTGSVVRDLDAIRAALGERKISYYGVSYGTLIGQQYAERFPGRVRALVLDSNMDHSLRNARDYVVTESDALEGSFSQFAAWCKTSVDCAVRDRGAVRVLDELMARADKGKLTDPDRPSVKIPPERLSERISAYMYDPSGWVDLSTALARLRNGKTARPAAAPKVEDPYSAILCADFRFPVRDFAELRSLAAASRRAAPHTRVNPLGWTDVTGCRNYLPRTRNPQRPYRIKGTPPILMTNSRHDVATPYAWAVNAARQIPAAVLLTYDGTGHGDYLLSRCATKAIDGYLLTVRTPPRGTHCPNEPPTLTRSKRPGFPLPGPR